MNNNSDTKYHRLVFSFFLSWHLYLTQIFLLFDYHLSHIFNRSSITSSFQCYVSYHHATYLLFRRKKNYNEINGTFPFSFPKITIHLSFVWNPLKLITTKFLPLKRWNQEIIGFPFLMRICPCNWWLIHINTFVLLIKEKK